MWENILIKELRGARASVFEYIDAFCHYKRVHSNNRYPLMMYEKMYQPLTTL
jgi:hypothetical protein